MNYKKIISVSFATLLLANTGAPVVANATTGKFFIDTRKARV